MPAFFISESRACCAVLSAVWELLQSPNVAATSIDQIAARSGVCKATIYRGGGRIAADLIPQGWNHLETVKAYVENLLNQAAPKRGPCLNGVKA